MKISNYFLLNVPVYLALAAISLPGLFQNMYSSYAKKMNAIKIEFKATTENLQVEDFKSELLFKFE